MKAITTRYIGATEHRPARISASDQDGNRIVVPVEDTGNFPYTDQHHGAASALCGKMGWSGGDALIGGSIKHGMVWVFPPEDLR